MARSAGELVDDLAVPVEAEPAEAVDDRGDRLGGRALAVGVLDAQTEDPAVVTRIEPVEQCGAGAADMQEAGRRGGETDNDTHGRYVGAESGLRHMMTPLPHRGRGRAHRVAMGG